MAANQVLLLALRAENSDLKRKLLESEKVAKKTSKGMQSGFNKLNFRNFLYGSFGIFAVQRALRATMKPAMDFERQLAKVSTMLDKTSMKSMKNFSKGLQILSVQFAESTKTLSKGLYDILSASVAPAKAMSVLKISSRAAVAGMTTTAVAADVITTIMNSYSMAAEKAAYISDVLFATVKRGKTEFPELATAIGMVAATASQVGLSFEEMQAAISTMTRQGINVHRATIALMNILNAFLTPTDAAREAAKQFGIELTTTWLAANRFEGMMKKLSKASPEEIAEIFPSVRGLRGMNAALGDINGFLRDLKLNANAAGLTLEAFAKMSKTAWFNVKQLSREMVVLTVEFGKHFLPAMIKTVKTIREWIKQNKILISQKLKKWAQGIINFFSTVHKYRDVIEIAFVAFLSGQLAASIYGVVIALQALNATKFGALLLAGGSGAALIGSGAAVVGYGAKSWTDLGMPGVSIGVQQYKDKGLDTQKRRLRGGPSSAGNLRVPQPSIEQNLKNILSPSEYKAYIKQFVYIPEGGKLGYVPQRGGRGLESERQAAMTTEKWAGAVPAIKVTKKVSKESIEAFQEYMQTFKDGMDEIELIERETASARLGIIKNNTQRLIAEEDLRFENEKIDMQQKHGALYKTLKIEAALIETHKANIIVIDQAAEIERQTKLSQLRHRANTSRIQLEYNGSQERIKILQAEREREIQLESEKYEDIVDAQEAIYEIKKYYQNLINNETVTANEDAANKSAQQWTRFADRMSNTIANAAMQSGNAFSNMAKAFEQMLIKMTADLAARAAIFSILSLFPGTGIVGGTGIWKGMIGGLFGDGGMAYTPQLAMVGDSGPERILNPEETRQYNKSTSNDNSRLTINYYGGSQPDMDMIENLRTAWRDGELEFLKG